MIKEVNVVKYLVMEILYFFIKFGSRALHQALFHRSRTLSGVLQGRRAKLLLRNGEADRSTR